MAFIITLAVAIASAVATAAVVLATTLLAIVAYVVALISIVAGAVAYAAITVISGVISGFIAVAGYVAQGIVQVYTVVQPYLSAVYTYVSNLAVSLYEGMQVFLEAIHFKTLLKIHKILELTSPSYRDKMRQFYGEIARVSAALGLGADYLNMMLQNARTVVLDVSSLMGRKYDLAEVTWLGEMNKFLETVSPHLEGFKEDPARILEWLNYYVYRPAVDAKGTFQQTLLGILDGTVTVVNNVVGKVINLREDLDQAILQLPPKISEKIYDKINPRLQAFDTFIEDEYRPVERTITNAMDVLTDRTDSQTVELGSLTQLILNPGDLLSNIDHLPELERLRQEAQIGEISSRSENREMGKINAEISDKYKGIKEIFAASTLITLAPPYDVPEIKGLRYPIGKIPPLYKSWFVGDF